MNSSLYLGQVRHRRFAPRLHGFRYSLFQVYLDLDELDTVFKGRWLWSTRWPNIAWFRRKDHLGPSDQALPDAVRDLVERKTGRRPGGAVRLLTHLRYFGYAMNPVSFYFCFDRSDQVVETIVAEVNNTPWGEQHCYVLDERDNLSSETKMRFEIYKEFHVSPFMNLDMRYRWCITRPDQRLLVHIENIQQQGKIFDATQVMDRQQINGRNLALALIRFPFMTAKVMLAIYFEAMRLWIKRIPFVQHPKHEEAPRAAKS